MSDPERDTDHGTGHDVHFLGRLERVGAAHCDLALRLYRDRPLVRAILSDPGVPAGAGRVALALARHARRARPVQARPQPGRNQPCPCGSGKKHKRCCGC